MAPVQFAIGETYSRVWVPQLDRYCCIDAAIRASQLEKEEAHLRFAIRNEQEIAGVQQDGILQLHGAMQSAGEPRPGLTPAMIHEWLYQHLYTGANAHRQFVDEFVAFLCPSHQMEQHKNLQPVQPQVKQLE